MQIEIVTNGCVFAPRHLVLERGVSLSFPYVWVYLAGAASVRRICLQRRLHVLESRYVAPECERTQSNRQHYPYQGCVVGPIVNSFTFVSSG